MRDRPTALERTLIGSVLALAVVAAPVHLRAAAPADRTELLSRAQSQLDAGQYRAAAESYAAYYEALGAQTASVAGENAVLVAVDAYRQAWDAHADRADLLAAQALLQKHIADFETAKGTATGAGVDEAKAELSWVEAKLEETKPADAAPPVEPADGPVETPEDDPTTEPVTRPDSVGPVAGGPGPIVDDPPKSEPTKPGPGPDKLGLGLTIGGAAGIAAGIFGLTYGTMYNRAVNDAANGAVPGGNVDGDFDAEAWRSDHKKVGLGLQVGGGVLLAVGGGLLTYGIVRLVRHSRDKATARRSRPRRGPAPL